MVKTVFVGSRKTQALQTAIANETNTDAGATWGAAEATLANSLKAKINSILVVLRASKVLGGSGKVIYTVGLRGQYLLTDIANEATADADATYGQPEADLLNSMKTKVNSILAAMRSAKIIGGRARFAYFWGQRGSVLQTDVGDISIANADATYTSGGAGEQGLTNDIKARVNSILAALRSSKRILT